MWPQAMTCEREQPGQLPTCRQIQQAIELYLRHAYPGDVPDRAARLLPPEAFDPEAYLMGEQVERDPADAPLCAVRSFALRLGNAQYPHMKLRLSRPPKDNVYLFTVDSHDAFLHAPPGSPDHDALAALKRFNGELAARIAGDWEAAGLPTERSYLRQKVRQAREGGADRPAPADGPPPRHGCE